MKSAQRIFILLLASLLLTSLASPWVASLWDAVPAWQPYRQPFSRIFDRLFLILSVALFLIFRRRLQLGSARQLGLQSVRIGYPDIAGGFFLSLASLFLLALLMGWLGIFTPYLRLSASAALERSVKALLAGFGAALIEEIFFRGIVFRSILKDGRPLLAFLVANVFYAAIHFVKPAFVKPAQSAAGLDPWAGFRHLAGSLQPLLQPLELLPGFLGLLLIGLVLSYAVLRTGTLDLSIGLHAGWIFGLKTLRVYGDFRREDLGLLFGASEPKIVSGVAAWIGIIAVGVAVHYMTRARREDGG